MTRATSSSSRSIVSWMVTLPAVVLVIRADERRSPGERPRARVAAAIARRGHLRPLEPRRASALRAHSLRADAPQRPRDGAWAWLGGRDPAGRRRRPERRGHARSAGSACSNVAPGAMSAPLAQLRRSPERQPGRGARRRRPSRGRSGLPPHRADGRGHGDAPGPGGAPSGSPGRRARLPRAAAQPLQDGGQIAAHRRRHRALHRAPSWSSRRPPSSSATAPRASSAGAPASARSARSRRCSPRS